MGDVSENPEAWLPGLTDPIEIGRGGFGVVYKARQTDLNRMVAVKILTGTLDELARQRFDRERRAMGALSGHPNIVSIYSSGLTEDGRPYLVMEFLPGGSMAERMEAKGVLSWEETTEVGVRLSAALETAHRAGVLHRDVKPENVFVSGLGFPKLGDFGIARLEGAPQTQSAMITASLAHASPELIDGKPPSVQSDVYSLASTMVTMMVGQPPFSRDTDDSIVPLLARIATEPLPDLRPRGVPDDLCGVFEQAMAKDPGARYESVADFGRALQEVQNAVGVSQTPLEVQGIDPTITPGSGAPRAANPTVDVNAPPTPPTPPPAPATPPPAPTGTGPVPPAPVVPTTGPVPPPPAAPPGSASAQTPLPPTSSVPVGAVSTSGEVSTEGGNKKWLVVVGVVIAVIVIIGAVAGLSGSEKGSGDAGGDERGQNDDDDDDDDDDDEVDVDVNDPDFELPTPPDTVPPGIDGLNGLEVTEIPYDLGDVDELDQYSLECSIGDVSSCDRLYQQSPPGTEYEVYGGTCGSRSRFSRSESCDALVDS